MKDINILLNNGVNLNKSLELFGDQETYDETLEEFLNGVNEKIKLIKEFKEKSDMANYAIYVHSLKSDARYFGFDALADVAYNHELASKSNDLGYVFDNFETLMNEARRAINIACTYLGKEGVKEEKNVTPDALKKSILVADDSDVIISYVKKIFSNNYNVITASDGGKVIEIINSEEGNKVVACLLDLNMPKVDGFKVLEYFKFNNLFDKMPVSIITGIDNKETLEKVFEYPIIDVLSKPFNEANVKRLVEKTINKEM